MMIIGGGFTSGGFTIEFTAIVGKRNESSDMEMDHCVSASGDAFGGNELIAKELIKDAVGISFEKRDWEYESLMSRRMS